MKFNLIAILYYKYTYCVSYFIKLQNIMFALKTYKLQFSKNISFSDKKLEIDISNKLINFKGFYYGVRT